MSFETEVITLINPLLYSGRPEFVYGTLFLENASTQVGTNVFNALVEKYGRNKISINTYSPANGFSYDFVA